MGDLTKGMEAGFAATILITILLFVQQSLGLSPQFNLLAMATLAVGGDPIMGWIGGRSEGLKSGYGRAAAE